MKHRQYLKRNPTKNYFPLPNEIFVFGLNSGEISVYSYLLYLENQKTFQCWPSYKTIGKAVDMSQNTVRKYVMALEEKSLISTEPTSVRTRSGQKRNGSLLYTIRLIQEALGQFYERQMVQAEMAAAKQRTVAKLAAVSPCELLCAALAQSDPPGQLTANLSHFRKTCRERKKKQDKGQASQTRQPGHNCPQCGQFRGCGTGGLKRRICAARDLKSR